MTETENKLDSLREKYPKVFPPKISTGRRNGSVFQYWGFECGPGWYDIIDNAAFLINYRIEGGRKFKTLQIKEKFGELTWYYSSEDEYITGVIRMAEAMSLHVCEKCGEKGKLDNDGWYRVRCKSCLKETK